MRPIERSHPVTGVRYKSVLFLCVANSARSQMAEGLARACLGQDVRVQSAGSRPTRVNPLAVHVMGELGIELSAHTSKSVDTIDPTSVDVVITLCEDEVCPVFMAEVPRLHWPLADPAEAREGLSAAEELERFRVARDDLANRITGLNHG